MPADDDVAYLTMCIDVENTIWLGGLSDKILKYKDNQWEKINLNNNFNFSVINNSIAYGSGNNLWISTTKRLKNSEWKNYLLKYEGNSFLPYSRGDLENLDAELVFEDTNRVILLMDNVLYDYKDTIWNVYDVSNNRLGSKFTLDETRVIWEATHEGLKKYQDMNSVLYTTDNSILPVNNLKELAINDQGNFIISSDASSEETTFLFEFDFENSTILYTCETGNFYKISAFVIDGNEDIWFGVDNNGLYKITGNYNGDVKRYQKIDLFDSTLLYG